MLPATRRRGRTEVSRSKWLTRLTEDFSASARLRTPPSSCRCLHCPTRNAGRASRYRFALKRIVSDMFRRYVFERISSKCGQGAGNYETRTTLFVCQSRRSTVSLQLSYAARQLVSFFSSRPPLNGTGKRRTPSRTCTSPRFLRDLLSNSRGAWMATTRLKLRGGWTARCRRS